METSDEELYGRMRGGDRRAFEELYERREPGLFRYALQMTGSRVFAEDAVQEAFLALIGPGSRFDARRGFLQAYLYGTVRNLVRCWRRSPRPQDEIETAVQPDILDGLIGDQMTSELHRVLRELPLAYRDAVVLCDLEEMSYDEAARVMQCPVGTVRSRLHRARALLTAKLNPGKRQLAEASR